MLTRHLPLERKSQTAWPSCCAFNARMWLLLLPPVSPWFWDRASCFLDPSFSLRGEGGPGGSGITSGEVSEASIARTTIEGGKKWRRNRNKKIKKRSTTTKRQDNTQGPVHFQSLFRTGGRLRPMLDLFTALSLCQKVVRTANK